MGSEARNPRHGERVNRTIHETASRLEDRVDELIDYLNDEVVPAIRGHSTRALRTAAEKLTQFAEYMEKQRGNEPPPNEK